MRKTLALFIFVLFIHQQHATAAQGCLVGELVYVTKSSTVIDDLLQLLGLPPGYSGPTEPRIGSCVNLNMKVWTTTSSGCRACPSGFKVELINLKLVAVCDTTPTNGSVANSSIIQCSLDDYSWALGAFCCSFRYVRD
ncbi:hypothetical protein [Pedobacter sp. Leaf250]|uniref:hypothetical protein n=1 Tax=Pedobacter sp. Leaf250 TaxID=2876559 RepID=UPI001E4B95F1|nr:hypothetical protein [Pedobacter sp. Leaf250]